ncbi:hypothetical protein GRI58_02650 [Porphyrobacter algicida]|uniref:Uncharacterized protein n=1 Tax=Qipengyuania algicida TaxID=1836209 RepID=A0A845ABB5_9SPHN|nr:hypothetical protein [Qipengyuania algicida]
MGADSAAAGLSEGAADASGVGTGVGAALGAELPSSPWRSGGDVEVTVASGSMESLIVPPRT